MFPTGKASGLEVFDGVNFRPFPYPQPDLSSASGPRLLFVSQNGNLWLAGDRGIVWYPRQKMAGVFAFHPTVFLRRRVHGRNK